MVQTIDLLLYYIFTCIVLPLDLIIFVRGLISGLHLVSMIAAMLITMRIFLSFNIFVKNDTIWFTNEDIKQILQSIALGVAAFLFTSV